MWRNVGCHTYGDTGGSVDKQVRVSGRENSWLLLRLIKVGNKIYGIFSDIGQHFHGNLAQTGLGISHGCRAVAVHGTEVAVTIHKRISGGPFLGHVNQSAIDRTVAMWMVFTHGITDDTGTLTMWLIRTVVQLNHRKQYTTLHRLQTVSDIRQGAGCNYTHGIVNVGFLHCFLQVYVMNFIKNIWFHSFLHSVTH